jgi:hypothetical protein
MIVTLSKPATQKDIKLALQDYPNYIKITVDIEKKIVVIGGEYHYDAEKILINNGSKQENIWGGGLDLITGTLETLAMINVRSKINPHQNIADTKIKKKFLDLAYNYLKAYVHQKTAIS